MKSLALALVTTLAATTTTNTPQPAPAFGSWGPINNGLRLSLSPTSSGRLSPVGAEFDVAVQNVGDSDVVVSIGAMLGNGRVMWPSAIRFALSDSAGRTRELGFFDRRYPGIAGRVDDFTVALRSGSTYVLRLSLGHYSSPTTKEFELKLANGHHRIEARFEGRGAQAVNSDTQGVALLNFWTGILRSNVLEFEVAGAVAQQ